MVIGGRKAMEKGKKRFLQAGVLTAIFAVALISGFFSAPFAVAQEECLASRISRIRKLNRCGR
jgi:hypothetical protein